MKLLNLFAEIAPLKANDFNIPTGSANDVLMAGLNITYFIAGLIAVIVIIIAGFTFVTSGSDPGAVAKARNAILYAVIGLVVVISAFAITLFISGRF